MHAATHDEGAAKGRAKPGLPLSHARAGTRLRVTGLEGERGECARMAALGIYTGAELELVCSACDAPCVIRVRESTVSLGAGVCRRIFVSPLA